MKNVWVKWTLYLYIILYRIKATTMRMKIMVIVAVRSIIIQVSQSR